MINIGTATPDASNFFGSGYEDEVLIHAFNNNTFFSGLSAVRFYANSSNFY
jgi:hypothetical protein